MTKWSHLVPKWSSYENEFGFSCSAFEMRVARAVSTDPADKHEDHSIVFFETMIGKKISIDLTEKAREDPRLKSWSISNLTVYLLQCAIYEQEGIHVTDQQVVFDDQVLEDSCVSLERSNMDRHSIVQLEISR